MTRMTLSARVGDDGVLHVPLGVAQAGQGVQVTIEPLESSTEEQSEYVAWLDSVAGQWQGDFERMPQDDFEQRDSM